ncbi:MAG: BMP family ABC transporter substrate-binding protein, partial [Meiothermus silvanus]|nr:BMP family ABC transporter substrate-binding protein [Allomeiothermus silvanus]
TLNHGLTSMLKRVDVATYEVIKSVVQKNFKGGVREFGLNNNGVGYALDQYNRALIPATVITKLASIRTDIIAGKIKVPSER